jgi:type VI protein secretion system component Hcp
MTQPDRTARNALPGGELSEQQLDQVAGGTGSQSTGAGAGKVTFNPFVITKHVDVATPKLS